MNLFPQQKLANWVSVVEIVSATYYVTYTYFKFYDVTAYISVEKTYYFERIENIRILKIDRNNIYYIIRRRTLW